MTNEMSFKDKLKLSLFGLFILLVVWFWPNSIDQDEKVKVNKHYDQWKEKIQMVFTELTNESCQKIWVKSSEYGINPTMLLCWIEVESGFDSLAVGQVGEVGWLQIKPSTARLYDPTVKKRDLFLTDVNVDIALQHFNYLMKRYENEALAFTAYNLGEGRLNDLLKSGSGPKYRYYRKIKSLYDEMEFGSV